MSNINQQILIAIANGARCTDEIDVPLAHSNVYRRLLNLRDKGLVKFEPDKLRTLRLSNNVAVVRDKDGVAKEVLQIC